MILKVFGGLIILMGTSVIGLLMGGVYKERVSQIRQLQYALHHLESEIVYSASTLVQAFFVIGEQSEGAIKKLLTQIGQFLKEKRFNTIAEAFDEASRGLAKELYLEKDERDTLLSFMQSLGSSDIEGQKKNFNITLKKFEEYEKRAQELRAKNEKLYKYLGFSAGAFLIIILV